MRNSSATFRYLMPYITDIAVKKLDSRNLNNELKELITEKIQDVFCDLISFSYTDKVLIDVTVERLSITIEKDILEMYCFVVESPYYSKSVDPTIVFTIYNEVYDFIKEWGLKFEHYEFLQNLRNIQISTINRLNTTEKENL